MMLSKKTTIRFIIFILIALLPSLAGIFFRPGSWYQEIVKPQWTPPNYLFAPVWMTLYVMIGVAGAIAWQVQEDLKAKCHAFVIYGLQLLANAAWSPLFFGMERPDLALINILLLLALVGYNVKLFWQRSVIAGVLLVPYLLWVGFASVLNLAIVWMN